ncbi:hypothetical protein ONS95_002934 [Cadophora gregata]|uniref:uncharacterized protein n=1 Tax=Cadophora gregata TaxID=51156 RepID=UPI0026DD1F33|nr:uncharacterized protein ONS95_002934 [Cadophora gregata]KAK0108112.1 hypothetical protein ONS95_002934 [Cadophora gregata]
MSGPPQNYIKEFLAIARPAILETCKKNDRDWYIGVDRITYRTIADTLNMKFGLPDSGGFFLDDKFVIEQITSDPEYYCRVGVPAEIVTGGTELVLFDPYAHTTGYDTIPISAGGNQSDQLPRHVLDALVRLLEGHGRLQINSEDHPRNKRQNLVQEMT